MVSWLKKVVRTRKLRFLVCCCAKYEEGLELQEQYQIQEPEQEEEKKQEQEKGQEQEQEVQCVETNSLEISFKNGEKFVKAELQESGSRSNFIKAVQIDEPGNHEGKEENGHGEVIEETKGQDTLNWRNIHVEASTGNIHEHENNNKSLMTLSVYCKPPPPTKETIEQIEAVIDEIVGRVVNTKTHHVRKIIVIDDDCDELSSDEEDVRQEQEQENKLNHMEYLNEKKDDKDNIEKEQDNEQEHFSLARTRSREFKDFQTQFILSSTQDFGPLSSPPISRKIEETQPETNNLLSVLSKAKHAFSTPPAFMQSPSRLAEKIKAIASYVNDEERVVQNSVYDTVSKQTNSSKSNPLRPNLPTPFLHPLSSPSEALELLGPAAFTARVKQEDVTANVEEIEMVTDQVILVEQRLREAAEDDQLVFDSLLEQHTALINKKNSLFRKQFRLNMVQKEEDLEKNLILIREELRKLSEQDIYQKTEEDRSREELLLEELVVSMRSREKLMVQQDEERMIEEEERRMMVARNQNWTEDTSFTRQASKYFGSFVSTVDKYIHNV